MWQALKENKRVQVAVGVSLFALAIYWLFSGSLLHATADTFAEPKEGETKSGVAVMAVLPIVFQVATTILAGIGLYAMNLGEWMFGKARALTGQAVTAVESVADGVVESSPTSLKSLTLDLGRAALANDLEKLEEIRWKIRKPQAIAELAEAYELGDSEAIDALKRELDGALAKPTATKKGKGAASA